MNHPGIVTACPLVLVALIGGLAWGGIEGSKHDFSHKDWTDGDTCVACHTPQRDELPAAAPLWDPMADLTRTFGTPLVQSRRASMGTTMCLRCHDGTVARDTIATAPRDRFVNKLSPALFGTGHGTSDHPVGIDYPAFDLDYRPAPAVIASGTVSLPAGKVECISCHDPHSMSQEKFMLVRNNTRSALCLTCHRK